MYDHHIPSHNNHNHNKQYLTTNSNNPYGKYQYQARQASTRHIYDLPIFFASSSTLPTHSSTHPLHPPADPTK
ncbi:uncharacterized protein BO88DRAFT_404151 [Aspergillus vadensis CBS 113365]|uniref:Uncharacterized protein n=1 Tax=Aspergillus vadensis (strain CBS 113365 / IMI 142717 / IBT 24658) TaxID=1448311 RepID=A0A319CN74_ASPVC|nr:hypothetical protein BO88DRAFT_404151 [Aspergillus vadensis CBS 113365]PYH69792.1 hypothetical protein BO88DRAFT_404151 [Aspergillus vadensis CBS 113365]